MLEIIDELIEAFLEGNHELSYAFNMKTKEVILSAPENVKNDEEAEFLLMIPQITSQETYDLMVNFAEKQDSSIATGLLDVLNGGKPFPSFKDKLREQGIADKWYEFENDYAKVRMKEWLEQSVPNSLG